MIMKYLDNTNMMSIYSIVSYSKVICIKSFNKVLLKEIENLLKSIFSNIFPLFFKRKIPNKV